MESWIEANAMVWPFPFTEPEWEQTPPAVQAYLHTLRHEMGQLQERVESLEARLAQIDLQRRLARPVVGPIDRFRYRLVRGFPKRPAAGHAEDDHACRVRNRDRAVPDEDQTVDTRRGGSTLASAYSGMAMIEKPMATATRATAIPTATPSSSERRIDPTVGR